MRKIAAILALLAIAVVSAKAQDGRQPQPISYRILESKSDTWGTATATCNDASINSCGAGSTIEVDTSAAATGILYFVPDVTGNVTGGTITLDAMYATGRWVESSGSNGDYTQVSISLAGSTYIDGAEAGWRVPIAGAQKMRLRLESAITCAGGAGSCTTGVYAIASTAPTAGFMVARQGEWDRLKATVSPYPDLQSTTVTTGNSTTGFDISRTFGNPYLRISGTWTGTLSFEQSATQAFTQTELLPCMNADLSGQLAVSTTSNSRWTCFFTSGMKYVRVSLSSGSGTANIDWSTGGSTAQINYNATFGTKALGGVASSVSPLLVGGYVVPVRTDPTTTGVDAQNDATRQPTDQFGRPYVQPGHPNQLTRVCHVADADNAQTGTACVTASGSEYIAVIGAVASCSAANTVNVAVRVMFDTDSTFAAAATTGTDKEILTHSGIPPGGGQSTPPGYYAIGAVGEDVRYTMADPVSGACDVHVNYIVMTF